MADKADPLPAADILPMATTDSAGAFAVRSLEPGACEIGARYRDSTSEPQTITVTEASSPFVRLVIPDDASLTLRLVSAQIDPAALQYDDETPAGGDRQSLIATVESRLAPLPDAARRLWHRLVHGA